MTDNVIDNGAKCSGKCHGCERHLIITIEDEDTGAKNDLRLSLNTFDNRAICPVCGSDDCDFYASEWVGSDKVLIEKYFCHDCSVKFVTKTPFSPCGDTEVVNASFYGKNADGEYVERELIPREGRE